jgi:uncharacterized protein
MSPRSRQSFNDAYGPWALISGASDGLGASLAREAAARGLNCVLVARREDMLTALAEELVHNHGVEARAVPLDLEDKDARDRLIAVSDQLDVGLYLINAGGDTIKAPLIDAAPDALAALINRNIILLTETLQAYAQRFVTRGRGGLAVIGSDSGFNGAGRISVYSASKAYALNLIESVWAELRETNVDAAYFAIGSTDTPKLRGLMKLRGVEEGAIDLAPPQALASWVMDNLQNGPTQVYDVDPASKDPLTSASARRRRVEHNTDIIDFFFGDLKPDATLMNTLKSGRSWK